MYGKMYGKRSKYYAAGPVKVVTGPGYRRKTKYGKSNKRGIQGRTALLRGKGGYWGKLIGSKIGGLFGSNAARVLGNIGDTVGDIAGYVAPIIAPELTMATKVADMAGQAAAKLSGEADVPLGLIAGTAAGLGAYSRYKNMKQHAAEQLQFQNELQSPGYDAHAAFLRESANDPDLQPSLYANDPEMHNAINITGRGAYTSNDLLNSGAANPIPSFAKSNDGSAITISHREYVRDIFGNSSSVYFQAQRLALNPGLKDTFPWLSQIAANYEEYEIKQLLFTYRSTTTDIGSSTDGRCGTIMMAAQSNPNATVFTDKLALMEYDGAMSCKVTNDLLLPIECDPRKISGDGQRYIRTGSVPADDLKDHDHGVMTLAVAGSPSTMADKTVGELWVTYTITLRKPKYLVNAGGTIGRDFYANKTLNSIAWPTSAVASALYSNAANIISGSSNNLGTRIANVVLDATGNSVTRVTFPAGRSGTFRFEIRGVFSASTAAGGVGVGFTGPSTLAIFDHFYNSGTTLVNEMDAGTSSKWVTTTASIRVTASDSPQIVDLSWQIAAGAASSVNCETMVLDIIQINPEFYDENRKIKCLDVAGNSVAM